MSDDSYPPTPWEIRNTFFDDRTRKLLALSEAQWWEYTRRKKTMNRIFPKAVKVLESLEEVSQAIDLNKKEQQRFFRSGIAQLGLLFLGGLLCEQTSPSSLGFIIPLYIWAFYSQIEPSLKSGDLKQDFARLTLQYSDLEKEFTENFGLALQFRELVQTWNSPEIGFDLIEKLQDVALSEIERLSQNAYRNHLEKLVDMHTF